ncbi:MAG: glycoside hydrolase family 48 protein [Chitinispirillia bacterium]|jgi:hypothetical protein
MTQLRKWSVINILVIHQIRLYLVILFCAVCFKTSVFAQLDFRQCFLELYEDIKDSKNGYFSKEGVPYHSIETMIVEAPDYGHETTSEAFGYYLWLEVLYGYFKKDWKPLNNAYDILEKYIIPTDAVQGGYNPSKPATYAPEHDTPEEYPAVLDASVPIGSDPIHADLSQTYGNGVVYGMHWLLDVDNWFGFGNGVTYINTFQRGSNESVWEMIPHPSYEEFKFGGSNGYLDLFTGDKAYSKQWRFTNASDADARVVQVMYWAFKHSKSQGGSAAATLPIDKVTKLGDFMRYNLFDKYFKKIGCQDKYEQGATGYESAHYLLNWYYAWGGSASDAPAKWSWRIGSSHCHMGYQNPMAAWVLANVPEFKPKSKNGQSDWQKSLKRQIEFYQWLQSAEGGIAGGATSSFNGRYEKYPAGHSTFYKMAYQEAPVYNDPPSNSWFGFQVWSVERLAEYYHESGDKNAEAVLKKWIAWVHENVKLNDDGSFEIPSTLDWQGQPDTWTGSPSENKNLHVTVKSYNGDIGVAGSLIKTLTYHAAATRKYDKLDIKSRDLAKELLKRIWNKHRDDKGVSSLEKRGDYKRMFQQKVYIPSGWSGINGTGGIIKPGVTFLDIRNKYKEDPDYERVKKAVDNGEDPEFRYHRFWTQVDVATAYAEFARLFAETATPVNNNSNVNSLMAHTLFPKVYKTNTGFTVSSRQNETYTVDIVNIKGKRILSRKLTGKGSITFLQYNLGNGILLLKISNALKTKIIPLMNIL